MNYLVKHDSNDRKNLISWLKVFLLNHNINKNEIERIIFNNFNDLFNIVNQNNLLNPTKLFIVEKCDTFTSKTNFEKNIDFIKFLNNLNVDIIFLINDSKLNNKNFNEITKDWQYIEIKQIDKNSKQQFINELLKQKNINLSKEVYAHLMNSTTTNCSIIENEIDKLASLINNNGTNQEQIDLICNYNEENIFNLIEAIFYKNHKVSWKIFNDLIKRNTDCIYIINVINSQLFNMYWIITLANKQLPVSKISEVTGLSATIININKNKFINYNINRLKKIINSFYSLEMKIKKSEIDKEIGLKSLLLEI